MNFLYIIYGDKSEFHAQAKLSILSLLRFLDASDRVHVLSDSAAASASYEIFGDRVQCHQVSREQFAEWFGPKKFFFRSKTLGLIHMMKKIGGDFCYLDTDTFAVKNPLLLKRHVQAGGRALSARERVLSRARDPLSRDYWKHLAGVFIPAHFEMWNAGIIALSQKDAPLLGEVVKITDELLQLPKKHVAFDEQIAQSLVFQREGEIYEIKNEILHYWGNKTGWNPKIFPFVEKYLAANADLSAAFVALEKFPTNLPLRVHSPFWPKLKRSFRKRWQEISSRSTRTTARE